MKIGNCSVCETTIPLCSCRKGPTTYSLSSEYIECPWCGCVFGSLWDHDWSQGDTKVFNCCWCDEAIEMEREVSVDYRASRKRLTSSPARVP